MPQFSGQTSIVAMPQGQQAIPEIQWAIIRLAKLLDHEQIGLCLNLSTRSVKQVITHFHQYGTIPIPGKYVIQKGRVGRRHLSDVDVEVHIISTQYASKTDMLIITVSSRYHAKNP